MTDSALRPLVGLLGSGEFLRWAGEVDRALLERARAGDGRVLVLPTASAPEGETIFGRWAAMGLAHYGELGIPAEVGARLDGELRPVSLGGRA